MSEKLRRFLSTTLTGFLGGVIALVVLALLALGPLQARGSQGNIFATETLPACLLPPAETPENCESNEKQLGLTLLQYYQDYDDKFPSGTQPIQTGTDPILNGVGWGGQVFGYEKIARVFTCPFDHTSAKKPIVPISYALNANLANVGLYTLSAQNLTVSLFEVGGDPVNLRQYDEGARQGSSVFSAGGDGTDGHLGSGFEGSRTSSVYYATGYLGGRPPASSNSQFTGATARDDGGTNILTADAHVYYVQPSAVSSGSDATTSNDPQTGGTNGTAAGTNTLSGSRYQLTFSVQ